LPVFAAIGLAVAHSELTGAGGRRGQGIPQQQPGVNYLTEGGQETEILYKYGSELPHFAMFPLLDNPRAMTELRGMYGRYLDTAARHGFGVVVAMPFRDRVPALLYAGIVGPRGDAYELNRTITADEAEEYHSEQLATLARADVDLVEAMTFNSVDEVIGLARAAAHFGLPLSVSFTLDNSTSRLLSGPTLKDAIETVDAQTQSAQASSSQTIP